MPGDRELNVGVEKHEGGDRSSDQPIDTVSDGQSRRNSEELPCRDMRVEKLRSKPGLWPDTTPHF